MQQEPVRGAMPWNTLHSYRETLARTIRFAALPRVLKKNEVPTLSVISPSSEHFLTGGANFLDSVYIKAKSFFIFRLSTLRPKSLWKSKVNMFPGRMLLIRRKKSKGKYQNDSLTSVTSQKKLTQKLHILTLYRVSHSEDLRILDLRPISIGFHTVKMYHFWTNLFGEITEVREPF